MRERRAQGVGPAKVKERHSVPRRQEDREAIEGAAKMELVIDGCLAKMSSANERMRRRQTKIDDLKDENRATLRETKRILAKLQAS